METDLFTTNSTTMTDADPVLELLERQLAQARQAVARNEDAIRQTDWLFGRDTKPTGVSRADAERTRTECFGRTASLKARVDELEREVKPLRQARDDRRAAERAAAAPTIADLEVDLEAAIAERDALEPSLEASRRQQVTVADAEKRASEAGERLRRAREASFHDPDSQLVKTERLDAEMAFAEASQRHQDAAAARSGIQTELQRLEGEATTLDRRIEAIRGRVAEIQRKEGEERCLNEIADLEDRIGESVARLRDFNRERAASLLSAFRSQGLRIIRPGSVHLERPSWLEQQP